MTFVFLLASLLAGVLILAYLESPNYAHNHIINQLVKESKRNERQREHAAKRGYSHVYAGWSMNEGEAK